MQKKNEKNVIAKDDVETDFVEKTLIVMSKIIQMFITIHKRICLIKSKYCFLLIIERCQ